MSSRHPRAGLAATTRRRVRGGAGREAGGAAGAGPRAPGGRIVFLRGAAAGVGAATWTLGSRDPTAPGRSDPSSIPIGRSSHPARAPITDCELGAVRGRCPPAAFLVSLTRISEQVPRSRDGVAGRRGGPGVPQTGTTFRSARGTREGASRCVPAWRRGSAELGCTEGGGDRSRAPSVHCWAHGPGASSQRVSLSRVLWIGERERRLFEARIVQRVENLIP